MRVFGFAFLVIVFLTNIFIVSAWAKPCLNNDAMDSPTQSELSMMDHGDMTLPCENMQQNHDKKDDTQHCDGLCLCLHVSTQQSPTLNTVLSLTTPATVSSKYILSDDRFVNAPPSTLKRPPRA